MNSPNQRVQSLTEKADAAFEQATASVGDRTTIVLAPVVSRSYNCVTISLQ